jgi:hypothetical protein
MRMPEEPLQETAYDEGRRANISSGDQSSGRETTLVDNEVYNLITTISRWWSKRQWDLRASTGRVGVLLCLLH